MTGEADMPEENKSQRQIIFEELEKAHARGDLDIGSFVKRLRIDVAGMPRAMLAKACHISERSLANIEANEGNPTLNSLNSVLKPFGYRVGPTKITRKVRS